MTPEKLAEMIHHAAGASPRNHTPHNQGGILHAAREAISMVKIDAKEAPHDH